MQFLQPTVVSRDGIRCGPKRFSFKQRRDRKLKWALFFLVISIIAGVFGSTGISAADAGIAKVLFFIFIIVFVVLLVLGRLVGSAIF